MTIKVGDTIPSMKLMVGSADGPKEVATDELFKGKKVVLFAVPGAFTPTCSAKHLPGFVQNAEAILAKGADSIVCMAVNDPFVMGAWAKDQGVDGKITMLADGSGAFTKAMGLELDLVARGPGCAQPAFRADRRRRQSHLSGDRTAGRLRRQPRRVDHDPSLAAIANPWSGGAGSRRLTSCRGDALLACRELPGYKRCMASQAS